MSDLYRLKFDEFHIFAFQWQLNCILGRQSETPFLSSVNPHEYPPPGETGVVSDLYLLRPKGVSPRRFMVRTRERDCRLPQKHIAPSTSKYLLKYSVEHRCKLK